MKAVFESLPFSLLLRILMAVAFLMWGSFDIPVVFRVTQDGTASREDPKERRATSAPWYSNPHPENLCVQGSKLTLTAFMPHHLQPP